jgi:hypothetical protein
MHLGLIDRPFVPHNLISAQEIPVPLPKFQMAPRLKILISSGSILFYPKSPSKQIPSRFPIGALMERDTWLQGIFTYLLIYLFISRPYEKSILPCSPKVESLWKQTPIPEPYLMYLSGSPVKRPSPGALHTEPLQRETPHSQSPLLHSGMLRPSLYT